MEQKIIIKSLVEWIENHLTNPMSVSDIALKSGYTKWHMQRMFKEVTGQSVGAYVRERHLTKAAIALRITSISILDISILYQFDSQQSFTRAFKKQFGTTPAKYRRSQEWDAMGVKEPIMFDEQDLPKETFIELDEIKLQGCSSKYRSTLDSFNESRRNVRSKVWLSLFDNVVSAAEVVYGFHKVLPGEQSLDEQILYYGLGMNINLSDQNGKIYEDILLEKGLYVQFSYQGDREKFQDFILKIYRSCMPKLGLIRRKGMDVEKFYLGTQDYSHKLPEKVRCDYLIPVRFS